MPPTPNRRLRRLRTRADLSTRQLGALAGVSAAAVSRIETGARAGTDATLAALAAALGVKPEVIGGINPERDAA